MTCRLLGTKQLPEHILICCKFNFLGQNSMKLELHWFFKSPASSLFAQWLDQNPASMEFCDGIPSEPMHSPHKMALVRIAFPCHDIIEIRPSNRLPYHVNNYSIWPLRCTQTMVGVIGLSHGYDTLYIWHCYVIFNCVLCTIQPAMGVSTVSTFCTICYNRTRPYLAIYPLTKVPEIMWNFAMTNISLITPSTRDSL